LERRCKGSAFAGVLPFGQLQRLPGLRSSEHAGAIHPAPRCQPVFSAGKNSIAGAGATLIRRLVAKSVEEAASIALWFYSRVLSALNYVPFARSAGETDSAHWMLGRRAVLQGPTRRSSQPRDGMAWRDPAAGTDSRTRTVPGPCRLLTEAFAAPGSFQDKRVPIELAKHVRSDASLFGSRDRVHLVDDQETRCQIRSMWRTRSK
jgi:hypothetical protein